MADREPAVGNRGSYAPAAGARGAARLGLALFLFGAQRPAVTAPDPGAGNLLATLSGITFALAVIGFRWLGRGERTAGATPLTAAAIGNFIACGVALPLALPLGRHSVLDWGILLYLGVFQIGIAYWFVSYAIARLSALETSVLLLLEPALNPVWSWLVLGEVPGAAPILGGILVLGATLARALWSEPQNSPEKRPGRLDRNAVATLE
jgi:DME family drug/metabolite transporter